MAAGHTLHLGLAGLVPDGARAAVIDLAAVNPAAAGYLTAWSCDEPMPATSNLNYLAGETRAAHAVVTLAADDSICIFTMTNTDVIVDVTGSYSTDPAALRFHPQAPERIYDSRLSGGAWRAGETRAIAVPPAAAAVAINVTITEPEKAGFVTVFPCQAALPVVSNINYSAGQVVANLVETGVSDGTICVHSMVATQIVVDLDDLFQGVRVRVWGVRGVHDRRCIPTSNLGGLRGRRSGHPCDCTLRAC